jgi:hypothetical protein
MVSWAGETPTKEDWMLSMKSKWRSVAILGLAAAAIAVPAWASSGGGGDVQQASRPAGSDASRVELAPTPFGSNRVALDPAARKHLDQAVQCMADRGFGAPPPGGGDGMFIPRSETDSDAFKHAASECRLPPPPTDAQIRHLGCADARARDEASDR